MVYATTFTSLFIYWMFIIPCRGEFVLRSWKYIIIEFMATSQKIIYTLLSRFMDMSLAGIGYDRNLTPLLLLFTIFKHMCLNNLYDGSKPPMNTVQHTVSKVLMFHEIQSCSFLSTVMTSIRLIMIPPSTSCLYLLVYLSKINLHGWRQRRRTDHKAPTPHLFLCGASETFDIANFFLRKNRPCCT